MSYPLPTTPVHLRVVSIIYIVQPYHAYYTRVRARSTYIHNTHTCMYVFLLKFVHAISILAIIAVLTLQYLRVYEWLHIMHWAEQNIIICQFSYGPIDLSTISHNRGRNQIRAELALGCCTWYHTRTWWILFRALRRTRWSHFSIGTKLVPRDNYSNRKPNHTPR